MEKEILRLFIAGSRLDTIMRRLKVSEEKVITVLIETPSTRDDAREIVNAMRDGTYHRFLYKEKLGRTPLPESKKRKLRQIRMSDEELEYLGNPNSTQMRALMKTAIEIKKLCDQLDAAGIDLVPSEYLNDDYPTDSPFWYQYVHRTLFDRLQTLAGNERCIQRFIDGNKPD